jgi:hypothetical protein
MLGIADHSEIEIERVKGKWIWTPHCERNVTKRLLIVKKQAKMLP